jgi:hypothetical protein
MSGISAGREGCSVAASANDYEPHRPDEARFLQIIEQHYPLFSALRAEQGRKRPAYVRREFEAFLRCGRLKHGFLRMRCERCHDDKRVAFSCKWRGLSEWRCTANGGEQSVTRIHVS